jgi:hypothetical protein
MWLSCHSPLQGAWRCFLANGGKAYVSEEIDAPFLRVSRALVRVHLYGLEDEKIDKGEARIRFKFVP